MEQKKTVKEIEREIAENSTVLIAKSKKPYSFVSLYYKKRERLGEGFSKCCPSDEWNEKKGIEIATARAVRDIRKQLMEQ